MHRQNRQSLRAQQGLTLIEVLIAVGIFSLALGIAFAVLHSFAHAAPQEQARISATIQLDDLSTQLNESAHSSVAVYTPAGCGGGNGTGTSCGSLRFYGLDSAGHPHFWGWDYNPMAKTLTQCLAYNGSEGACVTSGSVLTNVLAFTATPELASTVAANYALHGVKDVAKVMFGGDARVVAGNRVMIVRVGNVYAQRETHLLQSGAPFTAAVLKGTITPPPLGGTTVSSASTLWFWGTSATPIPATVTEANYGQYEHAGVPAPWWFVSVPSPCVVVVATPTPAPPSDSAQLTVSPNSSQTQGRCTFSASSRDTLSNNSLTAYLAGPFEGSASGVGPSTTITLNSIFQNKNDSASVSLQKTYDPYALQVANESWSPSTCSSVLSAQLGSSSGTGNLTSTSTLPLTLVLQQPVSQVTNCTLSITDSYGEIVRIAATIQPDGMKTWPAVLQVGSGGASLSSATTGVLVATTPQERAGTLLNSLLLGGVALASTYTGPCYAKALNASKSGPDSANPANGSPLSTYLTALGITLASDGCILNADGSAPYGETSGGLSGTPTGVMVAYEPSGNNGFFNYSSGSCFGVSLFSTWYPNLGRDVPRASVPITGTAAGFCTLDISDGVSTQTPAPDSGQVAVSVIGPCSDGETLAVGDYCFFDPQMQSDPEPLCDPPTTYASGWGTALAETLSTRAYGYISGNSFVRTAPGTVTIHYLQQYITITPPVGKTTKCMTVNSLRDIGSVTLY